MNSTNPIQSLARQYAALRVCVAYLGQDGLAGWWNCSFMSNHGLAVAQYNFPRNLGHATVMATSKAAKRLHDERIGRRQCVHLFRLPLSDEMLIMKALDSRDDAAGILPARREDAMNLLEETGREIITVEAGPVQVGSRKDAFSAHGLNELAKHYLAAFRQDVTCLPYFSDAKR